MLKSKEDMEIIAGYVETKMIPDHSEFKYTSIMATSELFVLESLFEWRLAMSNTFEWNPLQRHCSEYVVDEMAPLRFKCLFVGTREDKTTPKLSDRKVSPPLCRTRVKN